MGKSLWMLSLTVALLGCEQTTADRPSAPASFEVRGFEVDAKTQRFSEEVHSEFIGRGTLTTKDPRLLTGDALVLLAYSVSPSPTESETIMIEMREGVGTFSFRRYFVDLKVPFKVTEWRVVGWVPLSSGTVVATP